ncbi:MAG TPA: hypothetical protein VF798_15200 [Burkholderiaceae bacterium]
MFSRSIAFRQRRDQGKIMCTRAANPVRPATMPLAMNRFQFALTAIVFCCACIADTAHAYKLSEADRATFKSNVKTSCMKSNDTVSTVLEPGDFAAMCDCVNGRILDRLRTMPDSDVMPLLDPDSDEGKKKWGGMGREASVACGSKPFAAAMQKVIMKNCTAGKLKSTDGQSMMPAQRCDCITREIVAHYTLSNILVFSDQAAANRFTQQTMFNAQTARAPK